MSSRHGAGAGSRIGHLTRAMMTLCRDLVDEVDRLSGTVERHEALLTAQRDALDRQAELLDDLGAELDRLRPRVDRTTERLDTLDRSLDKLREKRTRDRDLPDERDYDHFALAGEYAQFVENDLHDLADIAIRAEDARGTAKAVPDSLERREAGHAAALVIALLAPDRPDDDALAARLGGDDAADDAIRRCTALRTRIREAGAEFGPMTLDVPSSTVPTRTWGSGTDDSPGFLVAPALLSRGTVVADPRGQPTGPWVFAGATDDH